MFVSLQIGRGLAATAVAAFHLSIALGDRAFGGAGAPVFAEIVGRGYLGVDFFFVLSGFIILQAHHRDIGQPHRVGRYVTRRFIRIYPIYWIYLTACIVGMALVGSAHLRLSSPMDWLTPFSLVRFTPVELPLAQAWTLFHEIVFYAVFTVLLFSRRIGFAVLGLWVIAIALSFQYPTSDKAWFTSVALSAYNLNFIVGMLAFAIVGRLSKAVSWVAVILGLALFGFSYRADVGGTAGDFVRLAYAISFGAILSGCAALERLRALRLPLWLGIVGDASYSIYLLHEHVENYSLRALMKIGVAPAAAPLSVYLAVLAITVGGGCAAYVMLERPLLRRLRTHFDRPASSASEGVALQPK